MAPDPRIFLDHILESVSLIEEYTSGKSRNDFASSVPLQDMVIRRLEVIGEAVKNLPESVRTAEPEVPWKRFAGLRDKLIHHYFGVDLDLTWSVIEKDLPFLKEKSARIRELLSRGELR